MKCATQIGIELTKSIKQFHELGYLHLDIKPDNVLIGPRKTGKLCLIDYGISEKYLDSNNKHRQPVSRDCIDGNLLFMSKYALDFES